jgi:hypothetical protein
LAKTSFKIAVRTGFKTRLARHCKKSWLLGYSGYNSYGGYYGCFGHYDYYDKNGNYVFLQLLWLSLLL